MKIIHFIIPILLLLSAIPTGSAVSNEIAVIASTPADAILAAQYAKEMGYKFVYTPGGELSADAKNAVKYSDRVIMIGGPEAISENVENQLNEQVSSVERVWGADRVDTSLALLKRLITEKPEALNNIVLAEGFNEDITPVALDFDAPILYFAPDNYEKIAEFMGTLNVQNAVVMGSSVPTDLRNVVTKVSQTTNLAIGVADSIVKTAISVASNLNPSILDSVAALVYSEYSEDPLMDAITSYSTGSVGLVVPLPSSNEDTIDEIVSKVTTVTSDISISSDSTGVSDSISEAVSDEGAIVTSVSSSSSTGGGGGSSSSSTTTTVQKYTVISIDGTEKVKFADISSSETGGNTLKITGEEAIVLPDITITTDLATKSYTSSSGNVSISYEGTGSGLNVIYPIENGALTYGSDVTATFYGSSLLANKQVTAHVINDRQEFRDAINALLNGNADTFITMLNDADKVTATTDGLGDADFTITPTTYGENIVLVTLGNGTIDTTATVLGISVFEYLKYGLTVDVTDFNTITNNFEVNMVLDHVPSNDVRYGVMAITEDGYSFTFNIAGTSTNDKNFDVSLVGDESSAKLVDNSELVSLTASSIKSILESAFTDGTAGVAYSDVTTSDNITKSFTVDFDSGETVYIIGIVYDITDKKIVALNQTEEVLAG
ncbi:methanogen extracellular protein (TIGR04279 family) [Methanococcus maripaludis]|uniref:Methanogen extracellular protein (TIGR04279 family) n=1 Tax=Methanococcus maripaludis TaxID=39152 RepID=A0A7J9P071_METMI|nr:TIGR04279 domain-containing protein [Methanococcus maripaludis]MBA2851406.1 methanogen extracellular protein (TIGR04279 family) [Methanococcus maripaludis]